MEMSIPAIALLLLSYSAGVHIFTGTFSTKQHTKQTPNEEYVSQCLVQTDVQKKLKNNLKKSYVYINTGEVLIPVNSKL